MIVDALFGKRSSPENPSVPLSSLGDGDSMWDTLTGGSSTDAGVSVNRKKALSISAFWRGVNLISCDVAKIPLVVFERLAGGGKERVPSHPAFHLLRRQSNPQTKAFDFKATLQHHALIVGNGYAYIVRRADGIPLELWQLNPYATTVVRADGRLWVVTSVEQDLEKQGTLRKLPVEDVLHIKGLGFDGLVGYDVVTYAKEQLGATLARRQYGAVFFANDATPGLVLEHPGPLKGPAQENIRKSWASIHQGLSRKHKVAVLAEGMTARTIAVDARKSQLVELQDSDIRQIANILGVPPHMLGDTSRTSYNSLEMESQSYLDKALDPWLVQWEEECTGKLLTSDQIAKDSHFVEFTREAILRVDHKTQIESLAMEVNNGLLTMNEARTIRNRPSAGPIGDKFRMPSNHVILGDVDADRAVSAGSHRGLLLDAVRRMHRRICERAKRAAKKPDSFIDWLDAGLEDESRRVFGEAVEPIFHVMAVAQEIDGDRTFAELADVYFADVRAALLNVAECKPSELLDRVSAWADGTAVSAPETFVRSAVE